MEVFSKALSTLAVLKATCLEQVIGPILGPVAKLKIKKSYQQLVDINFKDTWGRLKTENTAVPCAKALVL